MRVQSSLAKYQPVEHWCEDEIRAKAARLWHDTGTLMVKPEWIGNDLDRQMAVNIGNFMLGRRA